MNNINEANLLSEKEYEKIAYGILQRSAVRHLRGDQDAVDFLIYILKRNDLRYNPKKFQDIKTFRKKVSKEHAYKKLLAALRLSTFKKHERLPKNATRVINEDEVSECLALLENANLTSSESEFIYQYYYLNEPYHKIAKMLKMTTPKIREFHMDLLARLREVEYAAD